MPATSYLPAILSLTAVGVWGTSDFLGGLGARRANVFLFTSFVHLAGMIAAGSLALALQLPMVDVRAMLWSFAAGGLGGIGVALFYRALAIGKMGLIAPVSAVLAAGITTVITSLSEGVPSTRHIAGFVLAGIGVWLISRTEEAAPERASITSTLATSDEHGDRPRGLGLAVLAGLGFAAFFLCIHRAGNGSALWIAVCSRLASLFVTLVAVIGSREFRTIARQTLGIAVGAGILDVTGTVVFVRAEQLGRLDSAAVLSSLYPAVTVILARVFLHEHFSRARTLGMLAAIAAVPLIAG